MNEMEKQLENLFQEKRIIFWYDETGDMEEDFNSVFLNEIEKVYVDNNEFSIKYRIIIEYHHKKFLLYFKHRQPENEDNWLLDILLANKKFYTDKSALVLQSLGLDISLRQFVSNHYDFFSKSGKKVEDLKNMLKTDDSERDISFKIVSIICSCEPDLNSILFALLDELSKNKATKYKELQKYNFLSFFWKEVKSVYGYNSDSPSLKDFIVHLFNTNFAIDSKDCTLSREAVVFMSRWQDSTKNTSSFRLLSCQLEQELYIKDLLEGLDLEIISNKDLYKIIDNKIIFQILKDIEKGNHSVTDILNLINKRKDKFWYSDFSDIYNTILSALEFINTLKTAKLKSGSPEICYTNYVKHFYKIDTSYRKFIYYHWNSGQNTLLRSLHNKIEQLYSNQYLLDLNDNWQNLFNNRESWKIKGYKFQKNFYKEL